MPDFSSCFLIPISLDNKSPGNFDGHFSQSTSYSYCTEVTLRSIGRLHCLHRPRLSALPPGPVLSPVIPSTPFQIVHSFHFLSCDFSTFTGYLYTTSPAFCQPESNSALEPTSKRTLGSRFHRQGPLRLKKPNRPSQRHRVPSTFTLENQAGSNENLKYKKHTLVLRMTIVWLDVVASVSRIFVMC